MSGALLPVAILAGGLATRLLPITQSIPKALVDVAGEPFICHQLRLLRNQGVQRVVLCVGHLGQMIEDEIERHDDLGVDVAFSFDGPRLLGTAGALKKAAPLLGEAFFVLYGDSYLVCSLRGIQDAFSASRQPALMTVFRNEGRWDHSNVEFKDKQILTYDKVSSSPRMKHIDYGLGLFKRSALNLIPADEPFDLVRLHQCLLARGELAGHEVDERFYEIGSADGLRETREFLTAQASRP